MCACAVVQVATRKLFSLRRCATFLFVFLFFWSTVIFKGHSLWMYILILVHFADFTVLSKSFKSRASFGKKNRQNL